MRGEQRRVIPYRIVRRRTRRKRDPARGPCTSLGCYSILSPFKIFSLLPSRRTISIRHSASYSHAPRPQSRSSSSLSFKLSYSTVLYIFVSNPHLYYGEERRARETLRGLERTFRNALCSLCLPTYASHRLKLKCRQTARAISLCLAVLLAMYYTYGCMDHHGMSQTPPRAMGQTAARDHD